MSLIDEAFRYQPVDGIPIDLLAAGLFVAAIAVVVAGILFWFSQE